MSEFSNIPSLKLLRSVELFARFTVLQLSQLAEALVEVSFADGQTIVEKVIGVNIHTVADDLFSSIFFSGYQPGSNLVFTLVNHFSE